MRIRNQFSKVLVVMVLAIALAFVGCTESDIHKAAKATADISAGLATIQSTTQALYGAGAITADEAKALSLYVIDGANANDKFKDQVRALKSIDPSNKALVVGYFSQLAIALNSPQVPDVFHVKNPDAREKLQTALAGVDAAVAVIQTVLEAK